MSDLLAPLAPRFRPLSESTCEGCGTAILPYDPATEVRVLLPEPGRTRAWCSPACAAPAGWPWVVAETGRLAGKST